MLLTIIYYYYFIIIYLLIDIVNVMGTVEDPSDEFIRLRDYVDSKNCIKLDVFAKEKLLTGFSSEMVEDVKSRFLINKVCECFKSVAIHLKLIEFF